ncbi:MAG TPA: membrane dipeptidase, partial [Luteimonas sp.]|nr:membrane dipeptidase [Luteimonas sp.]
MNTPTRSILTLATVACLLAFNAPVQARDATLAARVDHVLATVPLIDGHNDLPWEIRDRFGSVDRFNFAADTATLPLPANAAEDVVPLMTDIPRLRRGHVGGQFWSVWIPTTVQGPAAIKMTLEQIDIVHNLVARYPADLQMAGSADDIVRAQQAGRIASLIGIEGGHQIDNSLPALRQMYALGARYMTLTHTSNTDWADAAT